MFSASQYRWSLLRLSRCSNSAAAGKGDVNEHGCVPINLYLQKPVLDQIWPLGSEFAFPGLEDLKLPALKLSLFEQSLSYDRTGIETQVSFLQS